MQKNKLALLGLASLLGLIGVFSDNRYYLGFFGFWPFSSISGWCLTSSFGSMSGGRARRHFSRGSAANAC